MPVPIRLPENGVDLLAKIWRPVIGAIGFQSAFPDRLSLLRSAFAPSVRSSHANKGAPDARVACKRTQKSWVHAYCYYTIRKRKVNVLAGPPGAEARLLEAAKTQPARAASLVLFGFRPAGRKTVHPSLRSSKSCAISTVRSRFAPDCFFLIPLPRWETLGDFIPKPLAGPVPRPLLRFALMARYFERWLTALRICGIGGTRSGTAAVHRKGPQQRAKAPAQQSALKKAQRADLARHQGMAAALARSATRNHCAARNFDDSPPGSTP